MSSKGKKTQVKKSLSDSSSKNKIIERRLIEVWCKRNGDSMNSKCFSCENKLHFNDYFTDYTKQMELDNLEPLCLSCMKGLKKYNEMKKENSDSETSSEVQRRNTRIENELLSKIPKKYKYKYEYEIYLRSDSDD